MNKGTLANRYYKSCNDNKLMTPAEAYNKLQETFVHLQNIERRLMDINIERIRSLPECQGCYHAVIGYLQRESRLSLKVKRRMIHYIRSTLQSVRTERLA